MPEQGLFSRSTSWRRLLVAMRKLLLEVNQLHARSQELSRSFRAFEFKYRATCRQDGYAVEAAEVES